jgi:hypothetical protein
MRLFGVDITFIDRSREKDVPMVFRYNDLQNYLASGEGSWDEQSAAVDEAYALRQEMINRGYLDAADYPEMNY